jgi:adenosine/AMP kinase
MKFTEIENKIKIAVNNFEARHSTLLEVKANERSLTHKLAECLQKEFADYDVDCEYNRKGFDTKRLNLTPVSILSDDDTGTTVYPDIIVHKRLLQDNNLLVIEAKKVEWEEDNTEYDRKKLKAFLSQLGYKFAVLVKFRTAPDLSVEWEQVEI